MLQGLLSSHEYDATSRQYTGEQFEYDTISGELFDDLEEMELAADLLSANNNNNVELFLNMFLRSVPNLRRSVRFRMRKALARIARTVLPGPRIELNEITSWPGARRLATAGRIFGLELEGLSPEDKEFEVARRLVRLVRDAAKKAALMPASFPPGIVAQRAVKASARRHAPELLKLSIVHKR